MPHALLVHGGTTGVVIELALIGIPLIVILVFTNLRKRRERKEEVEAASQLPPPDVG